MLVDLRERVHLGLSGTQLNDLLLRFSENLYLCDKLMVDLCYWLSLRFCCIAMDGSQFSFVICLGRLFAQSLLQVGTIWTSYPRESTNSSNSPEAFASRREAFLSAMVIVQGNLEEELGFWKGERSRVWIQRSQWKHQMLWVIPRKFIHAPKCEKLIKNLEKSNQRKHQDLHGKTKEGKTTGGEREDFTII